MVYPAFMYIVGIFGNMYQDFENFLLIDYQITILIV